MPTNERDLSGTTIPALDGSDRNLAGWLDDTYTDAIIVMKDGAILTEQYFRGMEADSFHLLNSVSKSFLGMLAGILVHEGVIDPEKKVSHYVPELAGGAFTETTVSHALDMTAAVAFTEEYANPGDDFWHEAAIVGWRPDLVTADSPKSLLDYARSRTETESRDGEQFHYRTLLTNVLGMVIERAADEPLALQMERRIWQKLGPEQDAAVVVDKAGFPYFGAGMNTCARDLARFGQMLLHDGAYNGSQIVPAEWIRETRDGSDELRAKFAATDYAEMLPGGHYKNQTWAEATGQLLLCIGIHGQTISVDNVNGIVIVKLSTHPESVNDLVFLDTFMGLLAIGEAIS